MKTEIKPFGEFPELPLFAGTANRIIRVFRPAPSLFYHNFDDGACGKTGAGDRQDSPTPASATLRKRRSVWGLECAAPVFKFQDLTSFPSNSGGNFPGYWIREKTKSI